MIPFVVALRARSRVVLALGGFACAYGLAVGAAVVRHAEFDELPLESIRPQGWLAESLTRQVSGMSGHHEVHGYPFDTCLWAGSIPRQGTHGADWWRYEQTAYLVDGLTRLAHLTRDPELLTLADANIRYVITHPHPDGRLGPVISGSKSEWPMVVFFRAALAQWLATGDQAIVDAFVRHYRATTVQQLSSGHRHILNLEGVLQCYAWTGDRSFLEKAEQAYDVFCTTTHKDHEVPLARMESDDRVVTHGVTWSEEIKLPTLLYVHTGNRRYLEAARNAVRKTIRDHMLVDGIPSSNEYLSGQDPKQSHETCVITDFTWTLGYLLMATGDAAYADMIERAIFNAGYGAVSKDFRQLQYFSSPNQFTAGKGYDHNEYKHGGTWNSYQARHETECCAGNVHRMVPNFALRQWMRQGSDGLAATFYAPSTVAFETGGRRVTVVEETAYPFSDTIAFTFHADGEAALPFSFRVPGWCEHPEAAFNGRPIPQPMAAGTFVRLPLNVRDGDRLQLRFPMPLQLHRRGTEVALSRGPLVFSHAIPEKREVRTADTKFAGFPALDLTPDGPWAYALDVDENNYRQRVQVVQNGPSGAYPYDPGASPVVLRVPARRVRNWALDEGRFTSSMPVRPDLDPQTETLTLVPLGSTRLRLTCFPDATPRSAIELTDWRISPVYPFDRAQPLSQQRAAPERGEPVAWTPLDAARRDGRVDLAQVTGGLSGCVYIAARTCCRVPTDAWLVMHAKDTSVLLVNGRVVATTAGPRKREEQPTVYPVRLPAGDSEILVKVAATPLPKSSQHLDGWILRLECVSAR